jgi:hypothetical protein
MHLMRGQEKVGSRTHASDSERFALKGIVFAGLAPLAGRQLSALSIDARGVLTLHLAATGDAAGSSDGEL